MQNPQHPRDQKKTINMVASVNVNVMIVESFVGHTAKLGELGLDLTPPLSN